jgi:hypothetical protein
MNNLIDILRTETQSLKDKYFEMTETWAKNSYNSILRKSKWDNQTWCESFGLKPQLKNPGTNLEFYSFPDGFYRTANYRKYRREMEEIIKVIKMGKEKYLEKQLKKAELHYESSLLKLAKRIELKKLNIENLKVITGYVGVNINMTLTDGEKTVKAFTIIAEGLIQRPHYRYLVK